MCMCTTYKFPASKREFFRSCSCSCVVTTTRKCNENFQIHWVNSEGGSCSSLLCLFIYFSNFPPELQHFYSLLRCLYEHSSLFNVFFWINHFYGILRLIAFLMSINKEAYFVAINRKFYFKINFSNHHMNIISANLKLFQIICK